MDLSRVGLSRSDICCIGPISGSNTLKLLPFGKSRRQKFIVGDNAGNVMCLQSKRGETKTIFKTKTNSSNNPITCVTLNNGDSGDKYFVSEGRSVRGLNKKGKEFCHIKTNLSEAIQNVVVRDKDIWVSGALTYASYRDGVEHEYLTCADAVSCLVVSENNESAFVGGKDNQIHVVENGTIVCGASTTGGVNSLESYGSGQPSVGSPIIYGTDQGNLGMITYDNDSKSMKKLWDMPSSRTSAVVNCLTSYDLTKDDVPEIIVGRDDGTVQVYKVDGEGSALESASSSSGATLQFERCVGESVRSVQAGVVSSAGYDEVVLCTYSGNIVSFSTEALDQVDEDDKQGRSKASLDMEGKSKHMRDELAKLEKKVEASHAKLTKVSGGAHVLNNIGFEQLQVNQRFSLRAEEGSYCLSFELPVPIESVLLQSSIPVNLLDSEDSLGVGKSQGNVVISTSNTPNLNSVYRCAESCKRLEIRLRTVEGQYGEINATVVANVQPKIAKRLTIEIKPLSLHFRIPEPRGDVNDAVLSTVKFSGQFSLNQAHEWIQVCLPDVPVSVPQLKAIDGDTEQEELAELVFENALVPSTLIIRYRQGLVTIKSDSISAIAIIREVFTKEANKRKINISIRFTINPETVPFFLKMLDKKMREQGKLARHVGLIDALKEITNDANDTSFLTKEYQGILKNAPAIKQKFDKQPKALETLYGIVYDLYVDVQKFEGKDAKNQSAHSKLQHILENYNYESLLRFFQT
uniref:Bardet-Biedl syndrome 7 protein n=1 Tax=Mucochytrium quahogii TaxID=96639 RepID=A0A7S2RUY9_9STRA|mmetsp:Transcript_29269/g.47020  ORF Transcript_29269/g.47020 Transcript_29269/m.47020 type:complete len:748 (-) Transcript_29269:38-2281(-)